MKRLGPIFLAVIAGATGFFVLAGYLFPSIPGLVTTRTILLNWAMIVATMAALVGVLNLFSVHLQKLRNKKELVYSLILLISLLATLLVVAFYGPASEPSTYIYSFVLIPVEASLMALLAVTLLIASIRLLRWRGNFMGIVFIATALIIFLGTAPIPFIGPLEFITGFVRPVIAQVLAASGARGILIGVALGSLLTGLRILLGADRPYGGK